MLIIVCFVFRRKSECRVWCALCSGEKGEVAVTKMLTLVCFVFREKGGIVTVVCFAFRGNVGSGSDEDADSAVLCVQGKSGRRQ